MNSIDIKIRGASNTSPITTTELKEAFENSVLVLKDGYLWTRPNRTFFGQPAAFTLVFESDGGILFRLGTPNEFWWGNQRNKVDSPFRRLLSIEAADLWYNNISRELNRQLTRSPVHEEGPIRFSINLVRE